MNRLFVVFFLLLTSLPSLLEAKSSYPNNEDEFVVVLDAGHGGHDPGNLGNGYLEKNIALNIVLKVGEILERNPNIKVIYTRKDDTFIDLFVRGEIANKANADLFVSVHCDSHTSDAHGAGTFVLGLHANKQNFEIAKKENSVIYLEDNYETRYADYNINSPESIIGLTIMQEEFLDQSINLAKKIQDNFSHKLNRKNREVKQAGFIVLHQTFMPSVLVETGFLTNDDEGAYLNSGRGQAEMGLAIAEAVLEYRNGVSSVSSAAKEPIISRTPEPENDISNTGNTEVSEIKRKEAEFAKKPDDMPVVSTTDGQNTSEEVTETMPSSPSVARETPTISEKPTETVAVIKEEPKPIIEKEAKEKPKVIARSNANNIVFKVQLMATTKDIALLSSNFNGLRDLSKEEFKQFKRYMYGDTSSYAVVQELKQRAGRSGYPSAYIVAYKDGKRIPTQDAIKMISQ